MGSGASLTTAVGTGENNSLAGSRSLQCTVDSDSESTALRSIFEVVVGFNGIFTTKCFGLFH